MDRPKMSPTEQACESEFMILAEIERSLGDRTDMVEDNVIELNQERERSIRNIAQLAVHAFDEAA